MMKAVYLLKLQSYTFLMSKIVMKENLKKHLILTSTIQNLKEIYFNMTNGTLSTNNQMIIKITIATTAAAFDFIFNSKFAEDFWSTHY